MFSLRQSPFSSLSYYTFHTELANATFSFISLHGESCIKRVAFGLVNIYLAIATAKTHQTANSHAV